jgi:hypothetical protein
MTQEETALSSNYSSGICWKTKKSYELAQMQGQSMR